VRLNFEVADSNGEKETPFIVSNGDLTVTVWGTAINVNTYDNEGGFRITLLDGSAKVQYRQSENTIGAGEQAFVKGTGTSVINTVDLEQVLAWKKGVFYFDNTNIQQVMRQMERWYGLAPTRYESEADKRWNFNGEITRYSHASDVLNFLAKTGVVDFVVKQNQIIVQKK
jgi:ferric-dicitrate binding protein FerR (iron transport regulator)